MAPESLIPGSAIIADTDDVARAIIDVSGREKQGKTHFAFTAPSPIVYLDFDQGSQGMVGKFVRQTTEQFSHGGKLIIAPPPFVVRPQEAIGPSGNAEKEGEAEWARMWDIYMHAITKPAVKTKRGPVKARSVIVDTGTELEELLRLKLFGKLTQVGQHLYRLRNSLMRELVRLALSSDVNVIFVHKLSSEWVKAPGAKADDKASKTGVYERKGWDELGHVVQAQFFAYRAPVQEAGPMVWNYRPGQGSAHQWTVPPREPNDLGFRLRCIDSRHNPEIDGWEWANEGISFQQVMALMMPHIPSEKWDDTPVD